MNGGSGNDALFGEEGNDSLNGGNGNDSINGGSGSDVIVGGAGEDRLIGSGGKDTFFYNNVQEGNDLINDFAVAEEVINLSQIVTGADYGSATPFIDYVELTQLGADTVVKIDPDGDIGDRKNQNLVTLRRVAVSELTADNFVFD
ncbi:SCP-like Type I secretion target protein (fragment) [Hyella patelloides LEGE 07179]|uniref:SCP-like Type I secretion target protein n=1 Tax=Hyella patelloides LEGE 07179 TaxID=945734 RepID=A0A563W318_9CYAN